MGTLLRNWKPHHKFTKALRLIIKIIAYLILIGFFVLPFCNFSENISQVSKWVWLGCALLNLDTFTEYKNAKKEKLFYPIASLYAILTLIYLHNYWKIIPLSVVVCGSIIIGLLEFIITVALTKTVRFCEKQKYVEYHPKMIHGFVLGGLYVCSITFFVMGYFVSQLLLFIFGGIALLFLAVSVLLSLSNGLSAKKNIINLIGFILDTLSFLALMIYLIYKIPTQFENLQTIITTIVAAVLGGALTLVGVAWTIRRQDEIHKRDEKSKYRPMFRFVGKEPDNEVAYYQFFNGIKGEEFNDYNIIDIMFKNFDNANFILNYVDINGRKFFPSVDSNIEKDQFFVIRTLYKKKETLERYLLNVSDILGNNFLFELCFEDGAPYMIREIKEEQQNGSV